MMKAAVTTILPANLGAKSGWACLSELVKARLTFLVLLTTAVGFYLGAADSVSLPTMVHLLAGTGLLAGGAAILNQWLERDLDARMERTRERPLPAGLILPERALQLGLLSAVSGLAYLFVATNALTALLGLLTLATYLLAYTPLKTRTPLNTLVGAIPGALPPLMGWTAATGTVGIEGVTLFAILAFWQIPHFMAIAWMYRDDYARAGFEMLSVRDRTGRRTAVQSLAFALGLVVVSLLPVALQLAGVIYGLVALLLGGAMVAGAMAFLADRSHQRARRLFLASILYLPLLLGVMVVDKLN